MSPVRPDGTSDVGVANLKTALYKNYRTEQVSLGVVGYAWVSEVFSSYLRWVSSYTELCGFRKSLLANFGILPVSVHDRFLLKSSQLIIDQCCDDVYSRY